MKKTKTLLALAVAATLPTFAFAVGPIDGTIYGKVNASVVNDDNDTDDAWKLNSNASRLGFKGKTEIADGLHAIYQAEFGINVDDGGGSKGDAMKNAKMLDANTALVTLPADVWFDGDRDEKVLLDFGGRKMSKITLDPYRRFPDSNPKDNVVTRIEKTTIR